MTYAIRYGVAGLIRPPAPRSKGRAPIRSVAGGNRATLLHGSCTRARLPGRSARRGVAAILLPFGVEGELQPAERFQRRVHRHELADQPLRLLGDPSDLLPAHR